jgi:hypothetical protein
MFLLMVLLAKLHVGEELGLLPAFFLSAVPIVPAVIGAVRGWPLALRLALQAAWLGWFVFLSVRGPGGA